MSGGLMTRWAGLLLALVLVVVTGCQPALRSTEADTGSSQDPESGLAWIAATDLPPEGRQTLILIDAGGPFPYAKDGTPFGNREQRLPQRARGYYHEYTVPTPGARDRGARRIVTGDPDEFYWTDDHYETFRRIRR